MIKKDFLTSLFLGFIFGSHPVVCETPQDRAIVERLSGAEWLHTLERVEYTDASSELLKLLAEKITDVEESENSRRFRCGGRFVEILIYQRKHGGGALGDRLSALGESLFYSRYWREAQVYLDKAVDLGIEDDQRKYYTLCLSAQVDLIFERRAAAMAKVERVLKACGDFPLALSLRGEIDPQYKWFPGRRDALINGTVLK